MANLIENFKENKKEFEMKSKLAFRLAEEIASLADDYAKDFMDKFISLVKDASDEEFRNFIETKDEDVGEDDKLVAILMRAKVHDLDIGVLIKH